MRFVIQRTKRRQLSTAPEGALVSCPQPELDRDPASGCCAPRGLPAPTRLLRAGGHRASPAACGAVAGVSPGGERILAWAAAAWPPFRHGQRYPSNVREPASLEEARTVGARSVVGALTLGLDVLLWQQRWVSDETLSTARGKRCVHLAAAPAHAETTAQAPASWLRLWLWNETEIHTVKARVGAPCPHVWLRGRGGSSARPRADGAPHVRPPCAPSSFR